MDAEYLEFEAARRGIAIDELLGMQRRSSMNPVNDVGWKAFFVPQCAQCANAGTCDDRQWSNLYRANYITCPNWESNEERYGPNPHYAAGATEEIRCNSGSYTVAEIAEAREALARLVAEGAVNAKSLPDTTEF